MLASAAKVSYETPDFPTHPRAFPGGIRVRLASGKTLAADLPYQQGHPQNPLSAHDIRAKFRANAALCLSERAVAALERIILNLEHQAS